MNPFNQASEWLIISWGSDGSQPWPNGIPTNAFQLQTLLTVKPIPGDSGLYAVKWQDQGDEWCSASGFTYSQTEIDQSEISILQVQGNTLVNFGGQSTVFCSFDMMCVTPVDGPITTMTVNGSLSVIRQDGFPEVGSGTFTAVANASPPVPDGSGARKKSPTKRKR